MYTDRPTGDKIKRADTFAVQLNAGNVYMLRGGWNAEYKGSLSIFRMANKDQVDATSGAFNMLVKGNKAKVFNY